MSTEQTDLREGSVRVALGDLLRSEWNSANAAGYDPTVSEGNGKHLNVTLGTYDENGPDPQIALRDVSEMPTGGDGYSAIKATGAGPIQTSRGRIDCNVFTGAQDDLPEHPQLLAKRIGLEVREIIHDNAQGIMDSATGELLVTDVACSRPRVTPDTDRPTVEWIGRCEVTYTIHDDPPER
ncbi:hypothetical protein [Halalkalicoccus sp. NIPERK01]|uniref:hypothetical protein n=1 Tax=Halalkalicoccus sp. NIPERK01 TaxID=3053469 RepID=UPI00256F5C5E|nr:hypothetical protein [Halalkalicoccus sp. NIPERK01]MDL5361352.1 hypothetical protein [Halalkalicoccus sp. NIPERK01]